MPVLLYLVALITTVALSAAGLAALAAIGAAVTVAILFRHELAEIRVPRVEFRRTDP